MKHVLQALTVTLALMIKCQASAAKFDDSDLDQASSLRGVDYATDSEISENNRIAKAVQDARLLKLRDDTLILRNWLSQISHSAGELDKRFKPSGFLGSRGKRFIPSLESLLLARYYQDAEKWKRQPHLGFHGSRG